MFFNHAAEPLISLATCEYITAVLKTRGKRETFPSFQFQVFYVVVPDVYHYKVHALRIVCNLWFTVTENNLLESRHFSPSIIERPHKRGDNHHQVSPDLLA